MKWWNEERKNKRCNSFRMGVQVKKKRIDGAVIQSRNCDGMFGSDRYKVIDDAGGRYARTKNSLSPGGSVHQFSEA